MDAMVQLCSNKTVSMALKWHPAFLPCDLVKTQTPTPRSMMNSMGNGGNRRSETRLLGIIDRELRRRILRNERQIIPETLRFEQPQRAPLPHTTTALGAQASWQSAAPKSGDYDSTSYAAAKLGSFVQECRVLKDPTGSSVTKRTR